MEIIVLLSPEKWLVIEDRSIILVYKVSKNIIKSVSWMVNTWFALQWIYSLFTWFAWQLELFH